MRVRRYLAIAMSLGLAWLVLLAVVIVALVVIIGAAGMLFALRRKA